MVCAVDIGGTWTKLGAVDRQGVVQHFKRIPTSGPADAMVVRLRDPIQQILSLQPEINSIGVSVAGFIDPAHSMMIYNPNLPWLEGYQLQAELQNTSGLPVYLEVDSNAAAMGEYRFGDGGCVERFLCLTIGTGLGAGFLIDGAPVRFTGECLGDPGHIIVEPGGRACTCGGRGCAEALVSAPALLLSSKLAGATLEELAPRPEMHAIFADAGRNIGLLAASLASIFSPDRIALCGGVCAASPLVMHAARIEFERSASDVARANVRIVRAMLGSKASLVGASLF